ncbi:molybdopterin-guanine dinucleotide biosynthesis protein B [Staphylococcus equorum]|uniref:Molybdopterin-guanine dinucleotide biosynthesis protein B n=1 Tax=Staphylococcus equorum TaxID=246432 RepID=A0A9X4R2G3_9STAP|nr:molybdopterin-guanine dinucleotide biosynthesis protein B [Staphylococcus equorum]MDG0843602.1 molybdopterin-guanine dinucleotide biosynthesis protein B [Staphylococcus equorum]MDG0859844.1 molybdopterin-guanine dinucleotide biosynthesis protein B [Staphylococcus equorum]
MILQIVGLKNSGKTTLMTHTIQLLKVRQLTVATVKHHGHHKTEDNHDIRLQNDQVDHMKHFYAGADQSIVQGNAYQQSVTRTQNKTLDEIIGESVTMDSNIILIEGFKEANYDKVLVYRNESDRNALNHLTHIKYAINLSEPEALCKYDQWLLSFFNIEGMN